MAGYPHAMTTPSQFLLLIASASVLVISAAFASVPDSTFSSISSAFVDVAGSTAGSPDACSDGRCGTLTVTVRRVGGAPIAGSSVVLDFSNCPDIVIACDQLTAVTGQSAFAGKHVIGTTNSLGQFTFHVRGAAPAATPAQGRTSPGTNAGMPCARVYADGLLLGSLVVAAYDVNASGSPGFAVSGADVSLVASESIAVALGATARARDDYNHDGIVTGMDAAASAAMSLQAALGTGSQDTGPYCP